MRIEACITENADRITAWAHALHRAPELSGEERRTTAFIREALASFGVETLDMGLETGVLGLLRGGKPGCTVALRADIDALPVREDPSHSVCSGNPGVMHACGHDVHTAALLGAALALAKARASLCGDVLFLFQSAEETGQGARRVLESGVLSRFRPRAVLAQHVLPELPAGQVGVRAGSVMAAQALFSIRIRGSGGHAAAPQNTRDPVPAGAAVITALQSLASRRINPLAPFVLSVCTVRAGTVRNVIPDEMELGGTFRFADNALRPQLRAWITELAAQTAAAHGCTAETEFASDLPAVVNDASLLPAVRCAAEAAFGPENVAEQAFQMISEDFAFYAEQAPSFMYYVGCGRPGAPAVPLHNGGLLIGDEIAPRAALLMAQSALCVQSMPCMPERPEEPPAQRRRTP